MQTRRLLRLCQFLPSFSLPPPSIPLPSSFLSPSPPFPHNSWTKPPATKSAQSSVAPFASSNLAGSPRRRLAAPTTVELATRRTSPWQSLTQSLATCSPTKSAPTTSRRWKCHRARPPPATSSPHGPPRRSPLNRRPPCPLEDLLALGRRRQK